LTRVLAIADEVEDSLYRPDVTALAPDLVVSCGDLPAEYLEYLVTTINVPLLFVPGNHDPDYRGRPLDADVLTLTRTGFRRGWNTSKEDAPRGCLNVDGKIVEATGLRVAGLGGSHRYSRGPNQYTQLEMRMRCLRLASRARAKRLLGGGRIDLLITHAPPLGVGDQDDPAHRGFASFHRLVKALGPKVLLHGHVHAYGRDRPDRTMGNTRVINAVGHRVVEVEK
jgi:predicted phosphodiesterase